MNKFRCVKANRRVEIQYLVGTKWFTYEPYVADMWDHLVSKIMRRNQVRFCSPISQKQFDNITEEMLMCVKSYYGPVA